MNNLNAPKYNTQTNLKLKTIQQWGRREEGIPAKDDGFEFDSCQWKQWTWWRK
jgi:hypothetical protein